MAITLITARATRIIQVSSRNLFEIAAEELGDALQWNRIARLNGITDPFLTGIYELKIPVYDLTASNGGVPL